MSIYGPRSMMKRVIPAATVLLLFGTAAYAISVHFKSGSTPTFDIPVRSLALESTGDLAGLGPGTVGLTLVATGSGTATCTNPSGANQPAGQNPVPITASGSVNFKPDHSGNASYDVTTSEPTASGDCPNGHWTETIVAVTYTGGTLTATQGGATVFTASCTFSPISSNGSNTTEIDATNVVCQ
jgi:hypothetical protein